MNVVVFDVFGEKVAGVDDAGDVSKFNCVVLMMEVLEKHRLGANIVGGGSAPRRRETI